MWTAYGLMWRDMVIIDFQRHADSGFTPFRNEDRS